MAKKKPAAPAKTGELIRDRVKELRRVKASELCRNSKNWRTHPPDQLEALGSMLGQIGYAGAALARELPDGTLELIDGHARAEKSGDSIIPVLVLDVNEQEADMILASYDTLGAMAGTDSAKLNELLSGITIINDDLASLLGAMAYTPEPDKDKEEAEEILEEHSEALDAFIKLRKKGKLRGLDKAERNFYTCLVFQSWEQKQRFLALLDGVPVLYGMYADGQTLAAKLGFDVGPNEQRPINSPLDKKLKAMAMLPPDKQPD